ncbi:MAG TPA: ABC transporter permease [Blastocatellia bacterium]|jgi:predicted permease|nr:ABC transporter permease [Blastocatellia bacterium]
MQGLSEDIRFGARLLLRKPGFTLAAVMTLALGIGLNTALFTVFDGFVLKPLPLRNPGSLVQIRGIGHTGQPTNLFSYLDYLEYRDSQTTLTGLAAWNKVAVPLGDASPAGDDITVARDESAYVFGQIVSGNYFDVLDARMRMGRGFLPEEDRAPGMYPVVVISHAFWQRQFDSDPEIIGKTVRLRGQSFTIIGVSERDFIGTTPDAPSFWVPLMMRDRMIPSGGWNYRRWSNERNADSFALIGRLKPGATRAQARSEMQLIAERLARSYPDKDQKIGVIVTGSPGFITLSENDWANLLPLPLAFALVLLLACANVANLLLARAATRQKEIAVRLALGATRRRLIRQLLTESTMVSGIGGVAGFMLAKWTLAAFYPLVLSRLPIPAAMRDSFHLSLEPDYRIFGFTFLISLVAGIAAGLAPALQASRPDLTSAIKDEGSSLGRHLSQSRLRNGLIIAQISVSMILLIGAGLLVRNLQNAQTLDLGLETENLSSIAIRQDASNYLDPARQSEVRRQLAERLRGLPGVVSVAQASREPLAGRPAQTAITIAGSERSNDHPLSANYNPVSPSYFETVGIQIVRGRAFAEQEAGSGTPVVVISESTVRKFWPAFKDVGEAIGRQIGIETPLEKTGSDQAGEPSMVFTPYEVIGVARDTRSGWVWEKDETYLYVPPFAGARPEGVLLVKTSGEPQRTTAAIRAEAKNIDPKLSLSIRRVQDNLETQMTPFRAVATIAGVLGGLALLLASIGMYGVISFVVAQRTREIGIRIALGAKPRDVVTLFLKQGLRLIAAGIAIGILGGAIISRLLAALLLNVSVIDPVAFVGVSVFLALVAMLACYAPARRATRADPMEALRHE